MDSHDAPDILGCLPVRVEFRILGSHGNNLVVLFAGEIDHGHQADGAGVNERQGDDRLLTETSTSSGIIVLGQRLGNKAIVRRIIHGGIEHAIKLDKAALLVELILHARNRKGSR